MGATKPAGDLLDGVFAELDHISQQLAPFDEESRRINYTPTGRLRLRLNEKQARRLAEIEAETKPLMDRRQALTKQACRIVANTTTSETGSTRTSTPTFKEE